MKSKTWKKYTFEFLSIFIAVISAFALNNWNDNRRDNNAESKILTEILNGLEKDYRDVGLNINGHKRGIESCKFWRKVFTGEKVDLDSDTISLKKHYFLLTRDFISIQNTSGYEALKSRGFELIKNDSLRKNIISLYEFDYQMLKKLEEEYSELQFHDSYFKDINTIIASKLKYDSKGDISSMDLPLKLKESEENLMLSYLGKIQFNRNYILKLYDDVEKKIVKLNNDIKKELNHKL